MEQERIVELFSGLAIVRTQNEEIIRRLNQQNGRVDKLEVMQWRIVVVMAGTVGGIEIISKLFL